MRDRIVRSFFRHNGELLLLFKTITIARHSQGKFMKRTLLALSITAVSFQMAQAAPFMPMDARGLAMGNTGVASAKRAHAPAYNPSLLSQARDNDDFSIIFPQVGAWISDEQAIIDEAKDINDDIFPKFESLLDGDNNSLESLVDSLTNMPAPQLNLTSTSAPTDSAGIQTAKDELTTALNELKTSKQNIDVTLVKLKANLDAIDDVNKDLNRSLNSVSGNPVSARLGLSGAVAVPSKKFAVAVSVSGSANISAKITMSKEDMALLDTYIKAAEGYTDNAGGINSGLNSDLANLAQYIDALDPNDTNTASNFNDAKTIIDNYKSGGSKNIKDGLKSYTSNDQKLNGNPVFKDGRLSDTDPNLTSTAEVVGVGIVDIGLTFSREFDIVGEKIAIGVTPKIQKIYTFHYGNQLDNFDDMDSDEIEQYRKDYTDFNLDVGASYQFGGKNQWMAGVVIKNLFGGSYDYMDTVINIKDNNDKVIDTETLEGGKVKLSPQVRGGIAYQSKIVNLAFDLDLIKNDPVAYEAATQFASFGAELDAWGWAQLRAGYRMNLKESSMKAVSAGIGLSPGDIFVLDITGITNPSDFKKESGVILEMGLNF